jgi:UDP-N-acetylglucosamine/UDP-N-acetylgalactosamine 4-epimerase
VFEKLKTQRLTWTVTGAAGFIGSHLVETLLRENQKVIGVDNFLTGSRSNLLLIEQSVGPGPWANFQFIEGNIVDADVCRRAVEGADFVLHQAALGSVPRSVEYPLATHTNNVDGFIQILIAAKEAKVRRFIYASSSSVYGDHPTLPKTEEHLGTPQSPYAVSKLTNELYAKNFSLLYGMETIGLRYFNVFGPRQDPKGSYAAVIPKWIQSFILEDDIFINGDGSTSRDFSYVSNIVQLNLLAALSTRTESLNQIYNGAVGAKTTLLELYSLMQDILASSVPALKTKPPVHLPFRKGDIQHSLADISKARSLLGYAPGMQVREGLIRCVNWYLEQSLQTEALVNSPVPAKDYQ